MLKRRLHTRRHERLEPRNLHQIKGWRTQGKIVLESSSHRLQSPSKLLQRRKLHQDDADHEESHALPHEAFQADPEP